MENLVRMFPNNCNKKAPWLTNTICKSIAFFKFSSSPLLPLCCKYLCIMHEAFAYCILKNSKKRKQEKRKMNVESVWCLSSALFGCNERCLVGFINCFELAYLINCQPAISIQQTTTQCNNSNNKKTDVRHNVTATVEGKLKSEKMQLELEMCKMKQLARCCSVRVWVTVLLCVYMST